MRYILILLVLLPGCDSRPYMRQNFSEGVHVMTDAHGKKWAIEHHIGDVYSVTEVK